MKAFRIGVLGIALLSGCAPEVTKWSPAESPKENRVDRVVFIYTFPYPVHGKGISDLERAKFLEFLKENIPSPYAVRVTLEEYGGHSDKRLKDITRELLKYGVSSDSIHRNFDHVDEHYGQHHKHKDRQCKKSHRKHYHHKPHPMGSVVEIVVERFVVITPSCANFLEQIGDASQAYNSSNFGCSTEANLGMMIANPRDLLRGGDRSPYDGKVMADGARRYEDDKIKPILNIATTTMSQGTSGGSSSGSGGSGASGASGGGY